MLALGFVCCVLFAFLYFHNQKPTVDVSKYYASSVTVSKTTPLYRNVKGEYQKIGELKKGQIIALAKKQNMEENYFRLAMDDCYILADHVTPTNSKKETQRELPYLPFNESLTTKHGYSIKDDDGQTTAVLDEEHTYPIYYKDTDTYGIMLHKQLYFIDKRDVVSIQKAENTKEETSTSIPVFMYHYFYSNAKGETPANGNWLEVKDFEEQLQYLKENNYKTLYMEDVERFLDKKVVLPKNSVSITIDDGSKSVYKYGYPLLKKYDMNATLFLITDKYKNDKLPDTFEEMRDNGMELQSHSYGMHTGGCEGGHGGALRCVAHDEGVADTKKSFDILGGGFVYCYPYGDVTDSALQIMKDSGVRMAFTTNYGKIEPGMDKLQLPRVRIFGDAGIQQFIYGIVN